jgi:type I restriction enzyme, R subunit
MPPKEAKARIKINNLLQESGWRLLDDSIGTANVVLENNVMISHTVADDMGEDYEKITNGYADYLLLDEKGIKQIWHTEKLGIVITV